MNRINRLVALLVGALIAGGAFAQQSSAPPAPSPDKTTAPSDLSTIRGCLDGQRGNYIVVEDKSGMVYVLKGVGNKLDSFLHHQVEVKGKVLSGTVKTGVRGEKAGSNPSDTVHGVDGVVLQVPDVQADVRTISKHCKAADQQ
jgi:hypothetical protein